MRACWPCFRPDPLLGFALQSVAPPPQPYAVSGASYPLDVSDPTQTPTSPRKGKPNRETHNAEACASPTAFRVLLRVRVRHFEAAVYTAGKRVALLGLRPSRVLFPARMARPSPRLPSRGWSCRAQRDRQSPSTGSRLRAGLARLPRDRRPSWGFSPRD
jgi:hypothetical protein